MLYQTNLQSHEDSIMAFYEGRGTHITKNPNYKDFYKIPDSLKYPNPFAPTTKFSFNLKKDSPVTLIVLDSTLDTVIYKHWTLIKESFCTVELDVIPGNLKTGVYKIKLITDYDLIEWEKYIVLR